MKLTESCPVCSKHLEIISTSVFGNTKLHQTKCNHLLTDDVISISDNLDFKARGDPAKSARNYQKDGIRFILESNFSCIMGDQMRMGKTPQSLLALANSYEDHTPCLIVSRAANLWQWIREYKIWCDPTPLGIYPIIGTKSFIPPGFKSYIISMDTLSRNGMVDRLLTFGFKLVIADEAHSFKNENSNRSQAIVKFLHDIHQEQVERTLQFHCIWCEKNWNEITKVDINLRSDTTSSTTTHYTNCPSCHARVAQSTQKLEKCERSKCGIVLLTGTAIKNSADEYFIPLNLVAPTIFTSRERFRRSWLEQNDKNQWTRINRYRYEAFKETIKPYVLRREKEDVYTDLPALNRIFTIIEPERGVLIQQYNKLLNGVESKLAERANPSYWDFADDLMQLRRICGLMKLPWTADYCEASLLDSDNSRIAIGIHHKDVRDLLAFKLSHLGTLKFSGENNPEQKDWIERHFENSPERILIINMLAGGLGMDFHYVNNILVLERQWSAADEEQFEFRFYNPDKSIKTISTTVEYILIKDSFEQLWYDMIETKRVIAGETIGTHWNLMSEPKLFKALLEETVGKRL